MEDEHGVLFPLSIKIDRRIGQSYVDGRLSGIESFGESQAPHFGKHGLSTRHCISRLPGSQSLFGAASAIRL
jgi:hypothetical protein